jgi:4-amino-4-deoxy-L-arabinose transferase-like glycosyltransferase
MGATSERARSGHAEVGGREARSSNPSRGAVLVTLSSLILVSLALRWKGIGATNLWFDEGNSWYVAHLSWRAFIDNIRASPLGPLYFAFLGRWMAIFGDSEAALRAPSLIASLLVSPVRYAIGARVFTRRAALVAAALLAVSPLQLYDAQEARMYMSLPLMAVLAAFFYLRWRDATFAPRAVSAAESERARPAPSRGSALRALACFTLVCTAMVHTNIVSLAFIAALGVDAILLIARRRRAAVTL